MRCWAYSSGSWVRPFITHASQPVSWSHSATRSSHGCPLISPLAQHLHVSALVQVGGSLLHQAPAQAVEFHGVFAEKVIALGSDEEGRIGKDEVETALFHRLETVTVDGLDVLASIQAGIETGAADGALIQIGGDHLVAEA